MTTSKIMHIFDELSGLGDHGLWHCDTIEVDGGWRCSQMIEFPVRGFPIWPAFGTPENDFVQPVQSKLITVWQPK